MEISILIHHCALKQGTQHNPGVALEYTWIKKHLLNVMAHTSPGCPLHPVRAGGPETENHSEHPRDSKPKPS